jgi:hypothetical protein
LRFEKCWWRGAAINAVALVGRDPEKTTDRASKAGVPCAIRIAR